jgi:hypothetical protein
MPFTSPPTVTKQDIPHMLAQLLVTHVQQTGCVRAGTRHQPRSRRGETCGGGWWRGSRKTVHADPHRRVAHADMSFNAVFRRAGRSSMHA